MIFDLDIEFWIKDDDDNTTNTTSTSSATANPRAERDRRRVKELRVREQAARARERELQQQQVRDTEREVHKDRFRREQDRQRYRARFEEERIRYGYQQHLRRFTQRSQQPQQQAQQQNQVEEEEDWMDEKMPSNQRYEALPQRPSSPVILSPIPMNNYNYNSGIPTSIPSTSTAAPSIISVPNSPPPSFHTHSSPGTPRPSHAQQQYLNNLRGGGSAGGEELWGVAPSTIGGAETLDGRSMMGSGDYLATITGLKQRVEWLEESMGRLLLEKEKCASEHSSGYDSTERTNCCVSFTDVSADLEQAFLSSRGTNCCVAFSGTPNAVKQKERRLLVVALLLVILGIFVTVSIVMTARTGRVNRAVNSGVDKVAKYLE